MAGLNTELALKFLEEIAANTPKFSSANTGTLGPEPKDIDVVSFSSSSGQYTVETDIVSYIAGVYEIASLAVNDNNFSPSDRDEWLEHVVNVLWDRYSPNTDVFIVPGDYEKSGRSYTMYIDISKYALAAEPTDGDWHETGNGDETRFNRKFMAIKIDNAGKITYFWEAEKPETRDRVSIAPDFLGETLAQLIDSAVVLLKANDFERENLDEQLTYKEKAKLVHDSLDMQLSELSLHQTQTEDNPEGISDGITSTQSDGSEKLYLIVSDTSLPYKVRLILRHAGVNTIIGKELYAVHEVSIRYKPVKRESNERKSIYDSIAMVFERLNNEFTKQNDGVSFTTHDGRSIVMGYSARPVDGSEECSSRLYANHGYVTFPTNTTLQLSFSHKTQDDTTYHAPLPLMRSQIHALVRALIYQLDRSKKAGTPTN